MLNIQNVNNGFYFTLLGIDGLPISEGQYSHKSGLWVVIDKQLKQVSKQ